MDNSRGEEDVVQHKKIIYSKSRSNSIVSEEELFDQRITDNESSTSDDSSNEPLVDVGDTDSIGMQLRGSTSSNGLVSSPSHTSLGKKKVRRASVADRPPHTLSDSKDHGNSAIITDTNVEDMETSGDSPFIPKDKLDDDDDEDECHNHNHGNNYSPIEKVTNTFTLTNYDHIPPYLQGNEFIQSGYRVNFSYKLCLTSIFKLHNETLNIWTHLLATILFFILMIVTLTSILENPDAIDKFLFTVFFICVQAQMLFSTLFHTFCSVSSHAYSWFARLDYTGISVMVVGSYLAPLYYLLKCHKNVAIIYITGITFLGVVGITVSMFSFFQAYRFRTFRAAFFIVFGLYIVIPLPHIWALEGFMYTWPILWRLALMGSIYIIGASIYASRCPECCYPPGKFDLGFSSHPIWHLFTIVAALFQLYNCIYAYQHYNTC